MRQLVVHELFKNVQGQRGALANVAAAAASSERFSQLLSEWIMWYEWSHHAGSSVTRFVGQQTEFVYVAVMEQLKFHAFLKGLLRIVQSSTVALTGS